MRYLISAPKEYLARDLAASMGLKRDQWTYIPSRDEHRRQEALRGRKADPEYLLGDFSQEERFYLYGRSAACYHDRDCNKLTITALNLAERAMKQVITTYSLGLKLGGTDLRMLHAALKAIEEAQK